MKQISVKGLADFMAAFQPLEAADHHQALQAPEGRR